VDLPGHPDRKEMHMASTEGATTRLRLIDREIVKELEIFALATSDFQDLGITGDEFGNINVLRDLLDARRRIIQSETKS
jgi:hypothetical protein